jgi:hypothetical protein
VFTAVAKDSSGNVLTTQPEFTWQATGGTVDANGNYIAGGSAGTFAVTAMASYGNQGTANITINGASGGGGGGGGIAMRIRKKGDYNNDGKVNDLDFSILMSGWGLGRTGALVEDAGNGNVGDMDFSIVMSNWTMAVVITLPANNNIV